MRSSEWLSLGYFLRDDGGGVGASAADASPRPDRRGRHPGLRPRLRAWRASGSSFVRDWAPPLAILAGYYLSGRFFVHPSLPFESWLMAGDRRWLGDPATRFARWPRSVLVYLEVVYMGCFLLIPAGFLLLATDRTRRAGRSLLDDGAGG